MTSLSVHASRVFTGDDEIQDAEIVVEDGVVAAIRRTAGEAPSGAFRAPIIVPGFIDTHVHGALEHDFASADDAGTRAVVDYHASRGTTSLLASVATGALPDTERALHRLARLQREGVVDGVHLEGPYLAQGHRGAHALHLLRIPNLAEIGALLDAAEGTLRSVTIAPELSGAIDAIRFLTARGVRVGIGHTDGGAEDALAALDAGATIGTHCWNGMPGLHHREPGPVGVLLDDRRAVVEIIVDGNHLHPTIVELTRRATGRRIMLVSDAMAATGLGDGEYAIAGSPVRVADGVAMLADGSSLAGSTITLADAFAAVRAAGWGLRQAVDATSTVPATIAGRPVPLAVGAPADLLVLDGTGSRVRRVMRHGAWLS